MPRCPSVICPRRPLQAGIVSKRLNQLGNYCYVEITIFHVQKQG